MICFENFQIGQYSYLENSKKVEVRSPPCPPPNVGPVQYVPPMFSISSYHIHANATSPLNRAPGNVKSPVFGGFLEQSPTFLLLLKSPLFYGFFKLNLTQNPILKNITPGLHQRGYGISLFQANLHMYPSWSDGLDTRHSSQRPGFDSAQR